LGIISSSNWSGTRVTGEAIAVKALRASSPDGDRVPKTNAAEMPKKVGFLAALIDLHALAVNPTKDMGRLILQGEGAQQCVVLYRHSRLLLGQTIWIITSELNLTTDLTHKRENRRVKVGE
jgi:hypothetical protein